MFDFIHNANAASFANSEPATLYTAARAVYGYGEMLNMEPAPFAYVPKSAQKREKKRGTRTPGANARSPMRGAPANS